MTLQVDDSDDLKQQVAPLGTYSSVRYLYERGLEQR